MRRGKANICEPVARQCLRSCRRKQRSILLIYAKTTNGSANALAKPHLFERIRRSIVLSSIDLRAWCFFRPPFEQPHFPFAGGEFSCQKSKRQHPLLPTVHDQESDPRASRRCAEYISWSRMLAISERVVKLLFFLGG